MPLATSIGRIGTRALLRNIRSTAATALHTKVAMPGAARLLYRSGVGVYRGWRRLPPIARRGAVVGAIGTYAGVRGVQGLVSGWRTGFMGPEDLHNHAHRYSVLGSEPHRRNQGRMPSNHLGHAGLGLSLSRGRHG